MVIVQSLQLCTLVCSTACKERYDGPGSTDRLVRVALADAGTAAGGASHLGGLEGVLGQAHLPRGCGALLPQKRGLVLAERVQSRKRLRHAQVRCHSCTKSCRVMDVAVDRSLRSPKGKLDGCAEGRGL